MGIYTLNCLTAVCWHYWNNIFILHGVAVIKQVIGKEGICVIPPPSLAIQTFLFLLNVSWILSGIWVRDQKTKSKNFQGLSQPVVIPCTFHSLTVVQFWLHPCLHSVSWNIWSAFHLLLLNSGTYWLSKQPHHAEFSRLCVWKDMTMWIFCKDRIIWVWKTGPQGFCCLNKV